MSHKTMPRRRGVTVSEWIGDIIGPSHKKIKVVSDCLSIYGFVLTVFCASPKHSF
jgi:hypothetical protein